MQAPCSSGIMFDRDEISASSCKSAHRSSARSRRNGRDRSRDAGEPGGPGRGSRHPVRSGVVRRRRARRNPNHSGRRVRSLGRPTVLRWDTAAEAALLDAIAPDAFAILARVGGARLEDAQAASGAPGHEADEVVVGGACPLPASSSASRSPATFRPQRRRRPAARRPRWPSLPRR